MNVKKMMLFALDFEVLSGMTNSMGSFRTYVACKDAKTALEMAEKTEVEDKPGSTLRFVGMLSVAPVVVEVEDQKLAHSMDCAITLGQSGFCSCWGLKAAGVAR